MKIHYYMLIAFLCILPFGCNRVENDSSGDFAKSVLKAGKAKDSETFVSKLSMSSVADLNDIVKVLKKANPQPQAKSDENEEKPTDAAIRKETEANVRLFLSSYADVFDGQLSSIITAQDSSVKGAKIGPMVIWVKQKDGKFRGIIIDSVWYRDDGTIKVITWTQLSGYEASKNAIKKKAILQRDTAEACDYPEWIEYQCVFTGSD